MEVKQMKSNIRKASIAFVLLAFLGVTALLLAPYVKNLIAEDEFEDAIRMGAIEDTLGVTDIPEEVAVGNCRLNGTGGCAGSCRVGTCTYHSEIPSCQCD
jgi:hypothetical protein